jgi:hypothetical protein
MRCKEPDGLPKRKQGCRSHLDVHSFNPVEIASIPVESLGECLVTAAGENDAIIVAMDELLSRAGALISRLHAIG